MESHSFSTPLLGNHGNSHRDYTPSSKRSSRMTAGNAKGSYEPYHSTPRTTTSPGSAHLSSFAMSSIPVNHSSAPTLSYTRSSPPTGKGRGSPSVGNGRTSLSPSRGRVGSPTRGYGSSPPRYSYVSELETTTIQKQRKELHLLIGELQDRDRELNEMVASHQKQLLAWEQDRQKLLTLEQRYSRLEGELKTRTDQVKTLSTKLKVLESQDQSKELALQSTQKQLEQVSDKASAASQQVKEMEEHNEQLNSIIRNLSSQVGHFEAREQELMTMLKLKDNDLAEASAHITDMSSKLKRLDHANKELRHTEATTRKELATSKQKYNEVTQELEKQTSQLNEQNNTNTEQSIELGQLQGDMQALQQELTLAGEREKRKDQLLDLQRSKQERTDAELTNLRQVYERQHRDLSLLQLNLDSKNEVLIRSQLSNSQHDDLNRSNNTSRSPANASGKSRDSSLHNTSLIGGALVEDNGDHGVPDLSSGDTEDLLTADSSGEVPAEETSPTSKLHRLLTESRQMVQSLEQTTLPPYINKPSKQDDSIRSPPTVSQE